MSETLERMQERARELARSGKFAGWRAVTFELQFEPSLKEAFQWLHDVSVEDAFRWLHSQVARQEIDRLCDQARNSITHYRPESALIDSAEGAAGSESSLASARSVSRRVE